MKQDVCILTILVFLLNQAILILVIGANNVKFEVLTVVAIICSVVYYFLKNMLPPCCVYKNKSCSAHFSSSLFGLLFYPEISQKHK